MSTTDRGASERDGENRNGDRQRLRVRYTTTGDDRTQCTLFPADVPPVERLTRWITAEEGSFVDTEEFV